LLHKPLQGYLSVRDWKTRLIFWSGALAVCGVEVFLTRRVFPGSQGRQHLVMQLVVGTQGGDRLGCR
jgi:hypothetical protein